MRIPRFPLSSPAFALLATLLAARLADAAPPPAPTTPPGLGPPAPGLARSLPVSAAGAELMREVWEAGGLRNNPRVREVVARLQRAEIYEETPPSEPPATEPLRVTPSFAQFLGNDVIVNDRTLSTCTCSGRPISQAEPSVAAWGPYVVASWNDRRAACLPSTLGFNGIGQGHGYSRDSGATYHEGFLLTGPGPTDIYHGDPTVAVNKKTGRFYISGVLRQGTTFVGVGAVRGHFDADSFVIDLRREVGLAPDGDFYDKPWMAVDSISGNVYITWTNFHADLSTGIELQRLDGDLNPLGPVQELQLYPYGYSGPQGSAPTVGPSGELYVGYGIYYSDPVTIFWSVPSRFEVVRSDDQGQTFGPPHVIAEFGDSPVAVPPGNQRGFYGSMLSLDVDRSAGPHRGRLYAAWSEIRPLDHPFTTGAAAFEQEKNDFFAAAQSFTPGDRIRGTATDIERDIYKFTGHRGDVFYLEGDTVSVAVREYLVCPADTASLASWHALGIGIQFECGLPYDGTYYLVLDSPFHNSGGGYAYMTALIPPAPGFRARDIRDQFAAYSDDGASWSTPVRLDDDPAGFDGEHVQVAVDGRGRAHTFWFDWRDDPECGTTSNMYGASSGDGGVTWGPNRRLTDASSFWGLRATCSTNNHGDYMQMAADGDRVYAVFPDSRLGDPDVFVDASVYRSAGQCPASRTVSSGTDGVIAFSLVNGGNFATPLSWRLVDDAGWLTGALPGITGQQTLAADGGSVTVAATVHPPAGCLGDSTTLRFITADPNLPGFGDTCTTVIRCDAVVATLLSLVEQRVSGDRVSLRWFAPLAAGAEATLSRASGDGAWTPLGTVPVGADGYVSFEDRGVAPGLYAYRIEIALPGQDPIRSELWIEVPALALTLRGAVPNPVQRGVPAVAFTLPSGAPATLDVLDLAGRRLTSRAVGGLGPGAHELRLGEMATLPGGIYIVRLRQGASQLTRKAVLMP